MPPSPEPATSPSRRRTGAIRVLHLGRRAVILLSLVIALLVGLAASIDLARTRERTAKRWAERLEATAQLKQAGVERWFSELRADAAVVASFPSVRALARGSGDVDPLLSQIIEDLRGRHQWDAVRLFDAHGDPVDGRDPDTFAVTLAREAVSRRHAVSELARIDDRFVFSLASPISDSGAEPSGAVVISEDPGLWVFPFLAKEEQPTETKESILVRREDDAILFVSPLRQPDALVGHHDALPDLAAAHALAGEVGVHTFVDYRAVPVMAATARIDGTDWGLVVKIDQEEVFREYRARLRYRLVALGGSLAAFLAIALLIGVWLRSKERENALRSEASFTEILDNASDAVLVVDARTGRITRANRTAGTLYGLPHDDLIGMPLSRIEAGAPDSSGERRRALESGQPLIFETTHLRSDGTPIPVEVSTKRIETERGDSVLKIVRDIRERKASEERMRAMVSSAPIGTIVGDIYGRVKDANDEFLRIVGRTRDDVEQGTLRWDDITPPGWEEADAAGIAEARARGSCTPYRKEYVRPDGTRVPVIVGYALLGEEREESVAFILDLTAQIHAEEQLRRINEELEQRVADRTAELEGTNEKLQRAVDELEAFSYSVSHDLRAPLRGIAGFARILEEEHGPQLDDEARRLVGIVREGAARMTQLVDSLLDLSRVERHGLETRTCDMGALALRIVHERTGGNERIVVRDLPDIEGDPVLLDRVWANLISNALKFTGPKAERDIEIDATVEVDRVVYRVRDNGVGFDMRYVSKLFGVFRRLHSAEAFPGSGVGLAIVKRIVERHGGSVGASSVLGEGAEFWFALPKRHGKRA